MVLEDYNPKIEYLPGRANVVADCLSRNAAAVPVSSVIPSFSTDSLRRAQREDPLWSQVLYALEEGDSSSVPALPVPFVQFKLRDGLLVRVPPSPVDLPPDSFHLVIPPSLVDQILLQVHDSSLVGHPVKERSLRQAQSRFWWPSMRRDIGRHIDL